MIPHSSFLMLRPDHFQVRYVINTWMEGNVNRAEQKSAVEQWSGLEAILSRLGEVKLITPQPGWPDMVFTANGALALGENAITSHFAHSQRQGEEPFFEKWFEDNGYTLHRLPPHLFFEGAGDALFDSDGARLWAAYGFRTSLEAHPYLAKILNVEVVSLRLVDPRFYHLDTCFCPLPGGYLLYYPNALGKSSNDTIDRLVPADKRIHLREDDAINFAANCVLVDNTIVLHKASSALKEKLGSVGFAVIETELTEFMKAGGAAKCLTLCLGENVNTKRKSACQVATRAVEVEGQLIDSRLMSSICDLIVSSGGSFMVKDLRLGQKRNEPSVAKIEVTSPTRESLDHLIQKIIRLGARLPVGEEKDATCEESTRDGVAPEKFAATTIYPTQVRTGGEWITVDNQRMDGVIVIEKGRASCLLIRDIKKGDRVVVGGEGTRLLRRPDEKGGDSRFGFMASSISSERKVELAIERVAWEMNRIRERKGRLVVVAGPVVAHTGGAPSLAWMIREHYLSALLGGNAIAVHDIESAMFGTSLGVDMRSGKPVEGGHRNHLAAINRIRRAGSIAKAVETGDLTSGLFFELVKQNIPFSLAGSIRDDGPLPETQIDLIKAQEDYARLIKGADMILMLSTMLHSIGAGNMTPSGVKLVCVDINPAVVTKLADRGSLESVGIVTDVGLFLSLLRQRLRASPR